MISHNVRNQRLDYGDWSAAPLIANCQLPTAMRLKGAYNG